MSKGIKTQLVQLKSAAAKNLQNCKQNLLGLKRLQQVKVLVHTDNSTGFAECNQRARERKEERDPQPLLRTSRTHRKDG